MESDASKQPPSLAEQIAELSRQVIETRNQIIKTENIVGNLASELKDLSRLQQQQRRGQALNTVSAYILFLILVSATFYFTYRAKVERLDFEKDTIVREHAATLNKLDRLNQEAEKRRETEVRAATFYRLTKSGQVRKALDQYTEIVQLPLSRVEAAVFQDWTTRSRSRLAYSAYAEAMKAIGEKNWKDAVSAFQRSQKYLTHPPHEASLRYYLGIALMNLGSYREAAVELEAALSANAEKLVSNEIRYYLGTIYEQIGRRDKAQAAYGAYLKKNSSGPLVRQAKRRLNGIK